MKWKRYLRAELLFDLALIAFSLFYLVTSFQYSYRNRVFPLSFAIIGLILAIGYLGQYIKRMSLLTDEQVNAYHFNWRPLAVTAILLVYAFGIYYLGLVIATCLFTTLFIHYWGQQKLWIALVCAGISFFTIYVLFGLLMGMPMYRGALFPYFGIYIPF